MVEMELWGSLTCMEGKRICDERSESLIGLGRGTSRRLIVMFVGGMLLLLSLCCRFAPAVLCSSLRTLNCNGGSTLSMRSSPCSILLISSAVRLRIFMATLGDGSESVAGIPLSRER